MNILNKKMFKSKTAESLASERKQINKGQKWANISSQGHRQSTTGETKKNRYALLIRPELQGQSDSATWRRHKHRTEGMGPNANTRDENLPRKYFTFVVITLGRCNGDRLAVDVT
jgi:hypothetical protein